VLALSGLMSERIALSLLIAYLLLSIEFYLATYTLVAVAVTRHTRALYAAERLG
jgi:hypothetical protein